MRIKPVISLLLLLICLAARAQQDTVVIRLIEENHLLTEAREEQKSPAFRHEFRLGVGDCFTDHLIFPDNPHRSYASVSAGAVYVESRNHRYLPHFFAGYDFTPAGKWTFGIDFDFSAFKWQDEIYSGGSDTPVTVEEQNCANFALLAHVRRNWRSDGNWKIYSAIGLGIDINTGSETDMYSRKTELGMALSITSFGVQYATGRFFVSAELGNHFAFLDSMNVYAAFSKLLSLSAGYRF